MGREVRRVPLDFDWPIDELWDGFLMPKRLHEKTCDDCENGYSTEAHALHEKWYGYAPFDPAETGSTPFTVETPEVRAFAERNVTNSPDYYYGTGEAAIIREARRLLGMWNAQWSHHLAQEDVDALVEAGRLMDFTHTWSKEHRWQPIHPAPEVTAEMVNRWSLSGLGHDSLNSGIVIRAACERLGQPYVCGTCDGHASVERWPGQRAEAEAWESIDPPTGDGWQLWTTTSEGSPMTPVFATPEALAEHCETARVSWFGSTTATRDQWLSTFVGDDFVHVQIAPGVVMM